MRRKLYVIDAGIAVEVTPKQAERHPDAVLITADSADEALRAAQEVGE